MQLACARSSNFMTAGVPKRGLKKGTFVSVYVVTNLKHIGFEFKPFYILSEYDVMVGLSVD